MVFFNFRAKSPAVTEKTVKAMVCIYKITSCGILHFGMRENMQQNISR